MTVSTRKSIVQRNKTRKTDFEFTGLFLARRFHKVDVKQTQQDMSRQGKKTVLRKQCLENKW